MQYLKSLPDHQTVLLGDLNAYQNAKKDRVGQKKGGTVKKDLHLCTFRKLKFIFYDFQLDDVALTLDCDTVTHECKRTGTKTRIDFFFLNDFSNVEKIETSENSLSDHYWVKMKLVTGTEIEIGSWKLASQQQCFITQLQTNTKFSWYERCKPKKLRYGKTS